MQSYQNAVNVPLLKGLPWLGTPLDMTNYFYTMEKYHQEHGRTFQLFLLGNQDIQNDCNFVGNHYVVTSDYKLLKHIFDHRSNFPMPGMIRDAIAYASGYAMFTSVRNFTEISNTKKEGDTWNKKHHTIAPLFTYKMLQRNFEVVLDMLNKLFSVIEREITSDRLINLTPYIFRLTMDVIGGRSFWN